MKKTITKLFCLVCALIASQTIMAQSEVLIDEPFAGSMGSFTTEYSTGTDLHVWAPYGDSQLMSMRADAYKKIGAKDVISAYMVSPEVELGSDGVINFKYMCTNFAEEPCKEVFVSVRTVGGEWTDIQGIGEFNDPTIKESGDILIPAEFNGKTIQIGLKYTSKGSNASGTWDVMNFKLNGVKGAGAPVSKVVFEEKFYASLGEFTVEGDNGIDPLNPIWGCDGSAYADAYEKHNGPVESYLVSPVITLANESQFAHFEHRQEFFTNMSQEVAFCIRTVGGEWEALTIPTYPEEGVIWSNSGSIMIPETYFGKDVQFGFKYTVVETEGVWRIKNFVVETGSGEVEKVDPELSFAETEFTFPFDSGDFVEPELVNPNNVDVIYTSSDENVAMVNSKGEVTILSEGIVTITAKSKETDKFLAGEASYTLTVTAPLATKVVFSETFETSLGEFTVEGFNGDNNDIWMFDVAFAMADGFNKFTTPVETYLVSPVISLTNEVHFAHYSQSTNYFNDPAKETSFCIRTVGGEWQALPVYNIPTSGAWDETDKIMIPESFLGQDVQFGFRYTASDPQNPGLWNISNFFVEKYCKGADPAISYIVNETVGFVDREFTSPAIVNPNHVAFTYASSNPEVATIDAQTGDVTILAEGQTVITATSIESDNFISAETSYTLYVKKISAEDVVYEAYFDENLCGFSVEGFNGDEMPIWKFKNGEARGDAFNKVANANTNYLVSPVIRLGETQNKAEFNYKFILDANSVTPMEDQFAFCVREEGGEWESIAISNLVANEMVSSGEIVIPEAYNGKKVQLGFMYFVENGQTSGVISLDNVIIRNADIATAIEGVTAEDLNNGKIYDLQGRRVNNPAKGIYVVNGKKVVIK